jgi:hypothetical protein
VTSGGQSFAIYTIGRDGSNPQRLTDSSLSAQWPSWRPAMTPVPPSGVPVLITEQGSGRAVALDSVTLMRSPLTVYTDKNFSTDRRTRVLLFAGNLDLAASEAVQTIEVRFADAQGRVFMLRPEGMRAVPGLPGVAQLTVRLPEELMAGGDVQVGIAAGGTASNSAPMRVDPSMPMP